MENTNFSDLSHDQEKQNRKPSYNQKHRDKQKAIQQGLYQPSVYEQAQQQVLKFENNHIEQLLKMDAFDNKLTSEELKKLKTYINNQKKKCKQQEIQVINQPAILIQRYEEETMIQQNKECQDIHFQLTLDQSSQDRQSQIKDLIDKNFFNFLAYMDQQQAPPTDDFLSLLIELFKDIKEELEIKLFVRVCRLFKGQHLYIEQEIAMKTLIYFNEDYFNTSAAFGFLRLCFQNEICFNAIPNEELIKFQSRYSQVLLNVFQSNITINKQISEYLPATCFIFTEPMLHELKSGGKELHQNIPLQFLPYFIEIISYSFENDASRFKKFIETFKQLCFKIYDKLINNGFKNLMFELTNQYRLRNQNYFMNLNPSILILTRAQQLLYEKKIDYFNEDIISKLILGNENDFQKLMKNPKLIDISYEQSQLMLVSEFNQQNPDFQMNNQTKVQGIDKNIQQIFNSIGIQNILPSQILCTQFCSQKPDQKLFIKFGIGYGKTSICLVLAVLNSMKRKKVFIINQSNELAFRDYKKGSLLQQQYNLKINYFDNNDYKAIKDSNIIYITLESFQYFINNQQVDLSEIYCIIDESDLIFLDMNKNTELIIKNFNRLKQFIAFSGATLLPQHQNYLETTFNSKFIEFPQSNIIKTNIICKEQQVFQNQKDYQNCIQQICLQQVKQTPIIMIIKDNIQQIFKQLTSKGIIVQLLINQDVSKIESQVITFSQKINDKYQVFIIDEQQGRGIDFQTTQLIEDKGGIYLIVGILPKRYLQYQQFLGRTGRINNKGQYSVILFDKNSQNQTGDFYIKQKLNQLENEEILMLNELSKLKISDLDRINKQLHSQEQIKPQKQIANEEIQSSRKYQNKQMNLKEQEQKQNSLQVSEVEENKQVDNNINNENNKDSKSQYQQQSQISPQKNKSEVNSPQKNENNIDMIKPTMYLARKSNRIQNKYSKIQLSVEQSINSQESDIQMLFEPRTEYNKNQRYNLKQTLEYDKNFNQRKKDDDNLINSQSLNQNSKKLKRRDQNQRFIFQGRKLQENDSIDYDQKYTDSQLKSKRKSKANSKVQLVNSKINHHIDSLVLTSSQNEESSYIDSQENSQIIKYQSRQ